MKKYLLKALAIMVCLHGLAWHKVDHRQRLTDPREITTAQELVAAFSPQHGQRVPESYQKAPITDLQVSAHVMQFKVKGVHMRFEWLGKRARLIRFNGRIFSAKDLSSEKAFHRAFAAKFGIMKKKRAYSLKSLFFSRALANIDSRLFESTDNSSPSNDTTAVNTLGSDEADSENNISFHFEGQKDFNSYVKGDKVFKDDASLANTTIGKRFERVVDLTTGSNLMAMARYVFLFQGALGFAMNPAGGFTPGLGVMNQLGKSPSSIPFPY